MLPVEINPILCILPPYLLKAIVENGTPAQRTWAIKTLRLTSQFRGQRQTAAEFKEILTTEAAPTRNRMVYDAHNSSTLPGSLVRQEGDPPTSDLTANEAYDGAGQTYNLFWEIFQRNSIDDHGMRIDSTVHFQQGYDNAFWNGQQMVYGDGDENLPKEERLFNRFTAAIDVIAHELTHGVTQFEASLVYWDQPGALNESFSDIFGSLVKQYHLRQTAARADWIIGEGLFTSLVNGQGIRSMKAPGTAYDDPILGKDPQPAHISNYVHTLEDNGGVHINSGIPNHAFYLAAVGIGGYAWEKTGKIWYVTLRDRLPDRADFQTCAAASIQVAADLYGAGGFEQLAVQKAWAAVGITINEEEQNTGCLPALKKWIKPFFEKPKKNG